MAGQASPRRDTPASGLPHASEAAALTSRRLFWSLTLRIEMLVHLIPLPAAVYFTALAGGSEEQTRWLIFHALWLGMLIFGASSIWRYRRLQRLSLQLTQPETAADAKLKLLRHPRLEAVASTLRWVAGVLATHALMTLQFGVSSERLLTAPFVLIAVVPVTASLFFSISTTLIAEFLKGEFPGLRAPLDVRGILPFQQRMRFLTLSNVLMPFSLLGYIILRREDAEMSMYLPYHLSFIGVLSLLTILSTTYYLGKFMRLSLQMNQRTFDEIAAGNFEIQIAAATYDEFGIQAERLNGVLLRLKDLYARLFQANAALEYQVQERTRSLEESVADITALAALNQEMNQGLPLRELAGRIVDFAESTFRTDEVKLYLVDTDRKALKFYGGTIMAHYDDEIRRFLEETSIPLDQQGGFTYRVYASGRPLMMARVPHRFSNVFDAEVVRRFRLKSALFVPLRAGGETIGVAMFARVYSAARLTKSEVFRLVRFCDQVSGAVHTARLIEQIDRLKAKRGGESSW